MQVCKQVWSDARESKADGEALEETEKCVAGDAKKRSPTDELLNAKKSVVSRLQKLENKTAREI